MNKSILLIFLFGGILFLGSQCSPDHHEGEHHHFIQEIKTHQAPVQYSLSRNEVLDTTELLKVEATLPEISDFFTEKRTHQITSFECSNCHSEPLQVLSSKPQYETKKAHWDIELVHASASTMNCLTCHSEENMNHLTSLTGEKIDLDDSYKLCSQCHSKQYNDWQGGAHGKQLNGWAPPRVAKTCVSCHNPHKPVFPSRFPARLNTQNLEE